MKTDKIIDEINHMTIDSSEDYDNLKRIDDLTELLKKNKDGHLACDAMINLLERNPKVEFGTPGEPIHTIENYGGHYEELLMASLERQPTFMTTWMLNRIINAANVFEKKTLIDKMKHITTHPLADEQTKNTAKNFYDYQTK